MFKEKWLGFKSLFADKKIVVISVGALAAWVGLLSLNFLRGNFPGFALGTTIAGVLVFSFILNFLVLYDLAYITGAFRDGRSASAQKKTLVGIFVSALTIALGGFLLFFLLSAVIYLGLILVAFVIWTLIEVYFLVQMLANLSNFTKHRLLRVLIYILVCVGYAVYLAIMVRRSSAQGPEKVEDQNLFDWIVTVVMGFYGLATMGARFLPGNGKETDLTGSTPKEAAKRRNAVLLVIWLAIGFQIYIQVINLITSQQPIALGDWTYNWIRLLAFIPVALVVFFMVLVKKPGKK